MAHLLDQMLDWPLAAPHTPHIVQPIDVPLDAQEDGSTVQGSPAGKEKPVQ